MFTHRLQARTVSAQRALCSFTLVGFFTFVFVLLAALPASAAELAPIPIPSTSSAPKINGNCGKPEYNGAASYTMFDSGGGGVGKVYLIHDSAFLYICITGPSAPNGIKNFGGVYLDPLNTKASVAGPGHVSLRTSWVVGNANVAAW
jgi:hypothetical protein